MAKFVGDEKKHCAQNGSIDDPNATGNEDLFDSPSHV